MPPADDLDHIAGIEQHVAERARDELVVVDVGDPLADQVAVAIDLINASAVAFVDEFLQARLARAPRPVAQLPPTVLAR